MAGHFFSVTTSPGCRLCASLGVGDLQTLRRLVSTMISCLCCPGHMAISAKPSGTLSRRFVTRKPAVKPHWPGALAMRQRRALEAFSVGLVQKLLHVPTVNLKHSFREGGAPDYV